MTDPQDWLAKLKAGRERDKREHDWPCHLSHNDLDRLIARVEKLETVLQDWVCTLSLMQQSVLITACRGPDGLPKDHISKVLLRWLRRCYLLSAFEGKVLETPYEKGGGSFTGPCTISEAEGGVTAAANLYLSSIDEVPHHFHLHLMHASEILGYKHPDLLTRGWWFTFYANIVADAHLTCETEEQMDYRLADNPEQWRSREVVVAQ